MYNKIFSAHNTKFKICDAVVTPDGVRCPQIMGQVGVVDCMSGNGYYYRTDFWDKIVQQDPVKQMIDSMSCRGTIEHPIDDNEFLCTPYENTSHIVSKLWVQNHQPFATFTLLNNPKGNAIKALLDVGATVGVSTRGMGQFGHDAKGQYVDDCDYMYITHDIVTNPNFTDLRMAPVTDSLINNPVFKELAEMHQLKDSAFTSYNRESLLHDMGAAIADLQKKYEILKSL